MTWSGIDACVYSWCWEGGRSFASGVNPSLSTVDGRLRSSWPFCCGMPSTTFSAVSGALAAHHKQSLQKLTVTLQRQRWPVLLYRRGIWGIQMFWTTCPSSHWLLLLTINYLHNPHQHRHLKADLLPKTRIVFNSVTLVCFIVLSAVVVICTDIYRLHTEKPSESGKYSIKVLLIGTKWGCLT